MTSALAAPPRHRFVLEMLAGDGGRRHDLHLERADFHRAVESAFFAVLRRGEVRDYTPPLEQAVILPAGRREGPASSGFEVVLSTPGGEHRERFGLEYFKSLMLRTGAQLALAGKVAPDARVGFRLTSFLDEPCGRSKTGLIFDLDAEPATIPIRDGDRGQLGVTTAWDDPKPDDFPVLIPRHVIEESVAEARQAPDREVGGVLLGHLRRDLFRGDLYLEVTCLVPCEQTQATALSVTFTHETWARVREVAEWRGEGELIVGWVHSHPFRLCAECPNPVPAECQAKVLFYSTDDEFLMETTFARPFMVGLLTAVEPRLERTLGHLPVRLYGWNNETIQPRGL